MAGKKNALDRAIESIDSDIAVLVAAKERLLKQQAAKPVRKPKAVSRPVADIASRT